MDPLSLSLTVLSALTLANNLYNSIRPLTKSITSNNRFKAQSVAFRIEILTLEQWLKNSAISGAPTTGSVEIQDLIKEFRSQAMAARHQLEKYSFADKKASKSTKVFSHIKYNTGGYEELNDIIVLLEKLNKALQTIAPPLPPGYAHATTGIALPDAREDDVGMLATSQMGRANSVAAATFRSSPATTNPASTDSVESQEASQDLQSLWKACASTFKTMALNARSERSTLEACRQRLSLWGSGLFSPDEFHIDNLLNKSKSLRQKLSKPLASRFIEIAMEQLFLIDLWLQDATLRGLRELKEASVKLRTLIITTELTQPLLEEMLYRALDKDGSPNGTPIDTDRACIQYLQGIVEVLFTYLPAINHLRKSQLLRTEGVEDTRLAAQEQAPLRSHSIMLQQQNRVLDLVETNLDAVQTLEDILRDRESTSAKATLTAYISLLAKERQRLEEWGQNKNRGSFNKSAELEIFKVQEDLNTQLEPLLKSFNTSSQPGSSKDTTAESEKQRILTKEQLDRVVDSLHNSTTQLVQATFS